MQEVVDGKVVLVISSGDILRDFYTGYFYIWRGVLLRMWADFQANRPVISNRHQLPEQFRPYLQRLDDMFRTHF